MTARRKRRDFTATTDADGTYELFLAAGTYAVSGVAFGYAAERARGVVIETDLTTDAGLRSSTPCRASTSPAW